MPDTTDNAAAWEKAQERTAAAISQTVLEDMERQYTTLRNEHDDLQQQLQTAQTKLAVANTALESHQDLEQRLQQHEQKVSFQQTKIQTLEEEKKLGQERLDRFVFQVVGSHPVRPRGGR